MLRQAAKKALQVKDVLRRADKLLEGSHAAILTGWRAATVSGLDSTLRQIDSAAGFSLNLDRDWAWNKLEPLAQASAARAAHGIVNRDISGALGQGTADGLRLESVATTEAATAYNATRDEVIGQLPKKVADELWVRRDTAGDRRVCDVCERASGQVAPASVGVQPKAPVHGRCRCTDTVISREEAGISAQAWEATEGQGRRRTTETTATAPAQPAGSSQARPNVTVKTSRAPSVMKAPPASEVARIKVDILAQDKAQAVKAQREERRLRSGRNAREQARRAELERRRRLVIEARQARLAAEKTAAADKAARIAAEKARIEKYRADIAKLKQERLKAERRIDFEKASRQRAEQRAMKAEASARKAAARADRLAAEAEAKAQRAAARAEARAAKAAKPKPDRLADARVAELEAQRAETLGRLERAKQAVKDGKEDKYNIVGFQERELAKTDKLIAQTQRAKELRSKGATTDSIQEALESRLLTKRQRGLIDDFSGNSYTPIRKAQMGTYSGSAAEIQELQKVGASIERAIKTNVKFEGELFRGIAVSEDVAAQLLKRTELDWMGATTSSSASREIAMDFARQGNDSVGIVFRVKNGRGIPIQDIGVTAEQEVLMSGASKFRRIGEPEKVDGLWVIDLEQIK